MISLVEAATQGVGIYTIPEAARYARMHQNTLRNWFMPSADRSPVRSSRIDPAEMKAITFLDFVEAVAIRSLRVDYGVSFPRIRQAMVNAKEKYGVNNPFARRDHRTVLVGCDLHIILADEPENLVQLTGKEVGQKSFRHCLQQYIQDIDFDPQGIARLYRAFRFGSQEIVLNPKVHFGEPVVKENGYTARTLYKAAVAEGRIDVVAKQYDVSEAAVEAAYRYFNQELGFAA